MSLKEYKKVLSDYWISNHLRMEQDVLYTYQFKIWIVAMMVFSYFYKPDMSILFGFTISLPFLYLLCDNLHYFMLKNDRKPSAIMRYPGIGLITSYIVIAVTIPIIVYNSALQFNCFVNAFNWQSIKSCSVLSIISMVYILVTLIIDFEQMENYNFVMYFRFYMLIFTIFYCVLCGIKYFSDFSNFAIWLFYNVALEHYLSSIIEIIQNEDFDMMDLISSVFHATCYILVFMQSVLWNDNYILQSYYN
ncbi:hypothetical protein COBT_002510 [Conglomerata obtusa]